MTNSKYLYIDFEYNEPQSLHMGLVSVAMCDDNGRVIEGWLADGSDTKRIVHHLKTMTHRTVVCFNADAEARCFVALGLNPLDYKWIDLYLDYRQLQNKDINHQYGRYINKTVWGKFEVAHSQGYKNKHIGEYQSQKEFDRVRAIHKAMMAKKGKTVEPINANLLNATLNFTDISDADAIADMEQKDEVRNMIIRTKDRKFLPHQKDSILKYGRSDIKDMKVIMENMGIALERASRQTPEQVLEHRLFRGRVGAMMAVVASNGTPVCPVSLKNLTDNAWNIENTAKAELNIRTGLPLCQWKGKGIRDKKFRFDTFTKSYDAMAKFIDSIPELANNWPKTAEDKYSLASDVIEKYKANEVIKEYRSMLKTCNAMKNSKPDETGKSEVGKAIGDDNRLRCSLFPYGTQTGRNAAKAKQYIYAQGAWIKAALIDVPKGMKLVETDFSSQEFLIGGILSGDDKMIEAYKTDVYISFGVAANQYPDYCNGLSVDDIKKLGHSDQVVADVRQKLKAVVLGLSYGAGAETISANTGLPIREVEGLIEKYKRTYRKYYKWREKVWDLHRSPRKPLTMRLSGWYLGKDNDNILSTQNFPVQATGSTLLHVSLDKVLSAGIHVVNTLHDAIYYLIPEDDETTVQKVEKLMLDASCEVLGQEGMKIESEEWRHGERVITAKGAKDWAKYQKYVDPNIANAA